MSAVRRVIVMIDLEWVLVHHHQIFAGIQRYSRECGTWECSINPHADTLLADHRREGLPDGIVARATPRLAELARKTGVPVVNVWLNTPTRGLPSVLHDPEASGRMAAEHLLARGFRSFGFIGYSRNRGSRLQSAGFRETIEAAGYRCSENLASPRYAATGAHWQRFQARLGRWIDSWSRPIGIFAAHDRLARYLAEACRQRALKVPHDVALVGAFNEKVVCLDGVPALSSIDFGFEQVGYQAAALLDKLMNGAPPPEGPIRIAPNMLAARQSSDSYVVDHPQLARALRFIAEQAHTPIGVAEVAAHVATTRRTLARLFQRELKQTVHEAITRLRVERAKRRLMEPHAMLKTVAAECGFHDAIHLCKVFQRVEGVSPSDYRDDRGWRK